MEIGDGKIDCYEIFEQSMLEDAASYYSQLASELLCCMSYTDYIQKVVLFQWQQLETLIYLIQSINCGLTFFLNDSGCVVIDPRERKSWSVLKAGLSREVT